MTTYFSGFKIKGLRLKHNLQALEVATALDITPTYLSLIESGKKTIFKSLKKAAQLFNVTLEDFIESEELINDFEELSKKLILQILLPY